MIQISRESKAVVYAAGGVAGYGCILSLGLVGIYIVVLNPLKCSNFLSRYIREKYVIPNPIYHHKQFVEWLIGYGKKQVYKPVLFLSDDLYIYITSLYQNELRNFYLYPYIDIQKIGQFLNKKLMYQTAARIGLSVPPTLTSPISKDEIYKWNKFPAIIKPLVSRFNFKGEKLIDTLNFATIFGSKAMQVNNTEELLEAVDRMKDRNIEFCIQMFIPGENRNIANIKFVSGQNYNIPSCFISRKIRQRPVDFGICSVSKAEYIKELHDYAEKFCKMTEYVGPGSIEFKWSEKDNKWYFIELNPRLDHWVGMSTLKGVNLPLQQYLLSTGQELLKYKQKVGGKYWIDILGDYWGLKWRLKHRKCHIALTEILKPYLYFDEAIFNWLDPLPGVLRFTNEILTKILNLLGKLILLLKNICCIF